MAFGQQAGPPASAKQVAHLLTLLNADGYDFATGRHHYGLNQRQAHGKFTVAEASDLIDRLEANADGTVADSPTISKDPVVARVQGQIDTQRAAQLRGMPAAILADELERRGWAVIPPS